MQIRRIPPFVPLEGVVEPVDRRRTDQAMEEADHRRQVRRALHSLPSRYREALLLFYFHDMDVATAARSLSVPEGTVKARLSRGRDMLRRKLPRLLGVSGDRT